MKYTTILFDADDTLLDFKRAEHDALTKTLLSFSLPADKTVTDRYSAINDGYWKALERGEVTKDELKVRRFGDLCKCFGFDKDAVSMARTYEKNLSEMTYLLDGAEELCRDLSEKYRIYIVTNGIKEVQMGRLGGSPLKKYFIKAFVSEEMGCEKPKREYFEAVAREIPDFDKDKTVIIGDSLSSDMKGGINFGIDTCWFDPSGKPKPEGMELTYVVTSFDDIREIFLK